MRENVIKTLKYYDLFLRHDLTYIPDIELPPGYSFRFYQPGDEKNWRTIEASAREFLCPEEAVPVWQRYFGGKEEELKQRMLFVVNESGLPVATATAFYDQKDEKAGWVHWVSVAKEFQGKGLSKPLICKTLTILKEMGYPYACLHTQTVTWLAVKIYLDCGFYPWQGEETGWRIIRTLTNHEKLMVYASMNEEDILDPIMLNIEIQCRAHFSKMQDFSAWLEGEPRAGVKLEKDTLYFHLMPDGQGGYRLGKAVCRA